MEMHRISKTLTFRRLFLLMLVLATFSLFGTANAQWGDLVKQTGTNLATQLAQYFKVPVDAVKSLMKTGLSTEGVVQALLISQTSGKSVGKVTKLLNSNGNNIVSTAKSLGVAPKAYTQDKVSKVLQSVSGAAGDKTQKALGKVNESQEKAQKGASDAVDKANEKSNQMWY